jgi:hypothetical protein
MREVESINFSARVADLRMNPGIHDLVFPEQCEVMQFTGLLEKNGKEIFEGDILRVHSHDNDHDGQLMAVEWGHLGWAVKSKNWYSLTDHDKFSVVGNIYENPGLL